MKRIKNAVWSGYWGVFESVDGCTLRGRLYPLEGTIAETRQQSIRLYYHKNKKEIEWRKENQPNDKILVDLSYKSRLQRRDLKAMQIYVRDTTKGGE